MLLVLVQTLVAAAVGAVVFTLYRRIRCQSPLVGYVVAAGVLTRGGAGLLLFWISYLNADWLAHLHLGDGFWITAIDARTYYDGAFRGVTQGLGSISSTDPSAAYMRMLAIWMLGVGTSPAAAFYLNLVLYVVLAALLTQLFRPSGTLRQDLPCLMTIGAFSFSPALLVHSTQPLKDDAFAFLIAVAAIAALFVLRPLLGDATAPKTRGGIAAWLVLLCVALYLLAGIRAYFAFLFWGSLAVALAVFLILMHRRRVVRHLPAATGALLVIWISCVAGGGPYAEVALGPLRSAMAVFIHPSAGGDAPAAGGARASMAIAEASSAVHAFREGFERTGGETNITQWAWSSADEPPGLMSRMMLGVMLVFVPVSLARGLSLVAFEGGRGLLAITDIDTLFLHATFVAIGMLLYTRWPLARQNLPYLVLIGVLVIVTTGLMAYVVTNFGTLFRLRLMVAVPIWMLPLALVGGSRAASQRGARAGREQALPAL